MLNQNSSINSRSAISQDQFNSLYTGTGFATFKEDFLGGASQTVSAAVSLGFDNGWSGQNISAGTQTVQVRDGTWANPGQVQMITTATSGQGVALWRGGGGVSAGPLGNLAAQGGWELNIIAAIAATTSICVRWGVCVGTSQNTDAPPNWFGIEYDTANTGNTDSKFTYVSRASSVATYNTTGAVAADTNFHHFRIWSSTAGTINFSTDGSAAASISTNVPTTTMSPFLQVITRTTAAKTAYVDFYSYAAATSRT